MLALLIPADQFADIFAAGAVPAFDNLIVDKTLQRLGEGNVHRAHDTYASSLAKFGKSICGHGWTHPVDAPD
ncbi:MAG: hypothetical protein WDN30_09045 [Pararobbsia sp.]